MHHARTPSPPEPFLPWYGALSWNERLDGPSQESSAEGESTVDPELAAQRYKQWCEQLAEASKEQRRRVLQAKGLDEEAFRRLLGRKQEKADGQPYGDSTWMQAIRDAYFENDEPDPQPPLERTKSFLPQEPRAGLLELVEPLVQRSRRRLIRDLEALRRQHSDAPFEPAVERSLFQPVPWMLLRLLSRTLVLELNVARLRQQLSGESAEQRFQSFVQRLRRPEVAVDLLREYPVLARQLVQWLDAWARISLELMQRLCRDWPALRESLVSAQDPGTLQEVQANLGDRHRGGRTVMILRFESGFRLVYKPKALAVDQAFQELVSWLNQRGDHPPLRQLCLLDRGSYGWVEYLPEQHCTDRSGLRRFYRRQGVWLALFHALEATDFHYENMMAVGEHPVPVDLESLFHSYRDSGAQQEQAKENPDTPAEHSPALRALASSVLRVGLLPQQAWTDEQGQGVDLSALGFEAGQLTPHTVPGWEKAGTDHMRFTRQRMPMPASRHQPTLAEEKVELRSFRQEIEQGFVGAYRTLVRHRDELLAEGGPLDAFRCLQIRIILRATRAYALLLDESFHPDLLRDGLDRDILFDRLWTGMAQERELWPVVLAEQAELRRGDVPLFTSRPESRHLWTGEGTCLRDFLSLPGLEKARQRITGMDEADLDRQRWILRASLELAGNKRDPSPPRRYALPPQQQPASREQLIEAACAVGDRLEATALREGGKAHWIGLRQVGKEGWAPAPLGPDLYSGLPGVMLFLAQLGEISGRQRYTDLARETLNMLRPYLARPDSGQVPRPARKLDGLDGQAQARERAQEVAKKSDHNLAADHAPIQELLEGIGAFGGLGGLVYSLGQLSKLWRDAETSRTAQGLARLLIEDIDEDQQLDVIGGVAGALLCLLGLYQLQGESWILDGARRCGEHLLRQAQPLNGGLAWQLPQSIAHRPLAGFSHGASGIALALAQLAQASGESRFLDAACQALDYERSLFLPEAGNWIDLREEGSLMCAWCHGAPGIGLARLALRRLANGPKPGAGRLWNPSLRADLNIALATTGNYGFDDNHCLCHGAMGNLELLAEAGRQLELKPLQQRSRVLAGRLLASIEEHGWLCGVPGQLEVPGLMTGLAGIGHGLLRLAVPERVASLLTLEVA